MSKLCSRGEDVTLALMQDSASLFEPLQSHNYVSSMCDPKNVTRPIAILAYCNVCLSVCASIVTFSITRWLFIKLPLMLTSNKRNDEIWIYIEIRVLRNMDQMQHLYRKCQERHACLHIDLVRPA